MEDQNLHYWHIMVFYFKMAKMRLKRPIKSVMCTERIYFQYVCVKRWFENFQSGILSVKDSSRPDHLTEIDTVKIKILNENP